MVALLLSAVSQAADKRPRLLFIMVDDQSPYHLNMYDSQSTLERHRSCTKPPEIQLEVHACDRELLTGLQFGRVYVT
jgi:hypothetical protein